MNNQQIREILEKRLNWLNEKLSKAKVILLEENDEETLNILYDLSNDVADLENIIDGLIYEIEKNME